VNPPGSSSIPSPPRAAYVHVPFCRHRCAYCNFTVVAGRGDLIQRYFQALDVELESLEEPREIDTLYIGGGTPTELGAEPLEHLLDRLNHWFPVAENSEVTVEANPDGFSVELAQRLVRAGVNRISLGVQSFQTTKLKQLDRQHGAEDSRRAVEIAASNFDNVSLDLIFAAPEETLAMWQEDLNVAIDLGPRHISTYGLTIEKGTLFWNARLRGELRETTDSIQADMYVRALDSLESAGFEHYEVSNLAQPGFRSRHNQTYWNGQPFWAFGPGAANYLDGRRSTNHRSTSTYIQRLLSGRSAVVTSEKLSPENSAREHLVLGLRRLEGIVLSEFSRQTGYKLDELVGETIENFVLHGWLIRQPNRVRLTRRGLLISDSLWAELL